VWLKLRGKGDFIFIFAAGWNFTVHYLLTRIVFYERNSILNAAAAADTGRRK